MSAPVFDDEVARRYAVDIVLSSKRLLAIRGVTTGPNPALKAIDLWPRLESALVQASTGARSFPEFCTVLLSRLHRMTPSKAWSRMIDALSRGETVKDDGEVYYSSTLALSQSENWRRFKRVVRLESTFVMVQSQLENEQTWSTKYQEGEE